MFAPPRLDQNGDGAITSGDLGITASKFGKSVLACP
jgi:hypothetical protein